MYNVKNDKREKILEYLENSFDKTIFEILSNIKNNKINDEFVEESIKLIEKINSDFEYLVTGEVNDR